MHNDMTRGNPLKLFIYFSIPLLIGNLFQQLYSMVDAIIVGRFVGQDALAAVGGTSSLFFLVNGFLIGMTSGFAVLVSQKFGAKDELGMKKSVASAVVLTLVITAITTCAMMFLTGPLLQMMNTPTDVYADAHTYISIIFAGIFTQSIYNMSAGVLRALGDSRTPLYFLIVACVINILLDLLFIIEFNMGVAGAAYATNVAQGVSAILCLVYSYKRYKSLRLKKEDFNVNRQYYRTHMRIGLPMALQFSITAIGIMTLQSAINVFGSVAMAAYTATSKVIQLFLQPVATYGITVATFAGQNMGARQYKRIDEGIRVMCKVAVVTSIIGTALILLFGEQIVGIFLENPTEEVMQYVRPLLNYAVFFFVPLGLIFVYRNALQGIGQPMVPMLAGVFELVARVLVAYVLPMYIGFVGVCLADPMAWLAAFIPLAITYRIKMRRLIGTDEEITHTVSL